MNDLSLKDHNTKKADTRAKPKQTSGASSSVGVPVSAFAKLPSSGKGPVMTHEDLTHRVKKDCVPMIEAATEQRMPTFHVVVEPTLSAQGIQAQAVDGQEIRVAHPSYIHHSPLMLHECIHLLQQNKATDGGKKIEPTDRRSKPDHGKQRTPDAMMPKSAKGSMTTQTFAQPMSRQEAEEEANSSVSRIMRGEAAEVHPTGVRVLNQDATENLNGQVKPDYANSKTLNENNLFRPDFIIRMKEALNNKLSNVNGYEAIQIDRTNYENATIFDERTIDGIILFQQTYMQGRQSGNGVIDATTRAAMEEILLSENGFNTLIGEHREAGQMLVSGIQVASSGERVPVAQSCYDRCKEIIEKFGNCSILQKNGGFFDTSQNAINILGIRGARIDGNNVRRTDGAQKFYESVIAPTSTQESNDTDIRSKQLYFYSNDPNAKTDEAKKTKEDAFDDVVLSIWWEDTEAGPKYYVQARQGSVDPGEHYPTNASKPSKKNKGTAHLRDGQYVYQLGRHGTTHKEHMDAIARMCAKDQDTCNMLEPEVTATGVSSEILEEYTKKKHTTSKKTIPFKPDSLFFNSFLKKENGYENIKLKKISYKALTKRIPTEVIRDANYDGILDENEIRESMKLIRQNKSSYRDTNSNIMINIHSSPDTETSSQGCQNIPESTYASFISECKNASNKKRILYTLLDGSKIEAEKSSVENK